MSYLPGVDVVMVNYRTPGDATVFIQSFANVQYEVPSSLTVVNVEPTPEDVTSVDKALEAVKVPTAYSGWQTNIGYATACNTAAKALLEPRATVAFFNADTILRPGVLDHCHWELHQHPQWGLCGPRQIDDYNTITSAGIFGTLIAPEHRGWKEPDAGQYNEVRDDCVSVAGSAYFVKRAVWDQLTTCPEYQDVVTELNINGDGAFLATRHYYNETWTSYHAMAHGCKIGYVGSTVMTHRWHQASPIGGYAEQKMPEDQAAFRRACDHHGIPHD